MRTVDPPRSTARADLAEWLRSIGTAPSSPTDTPSRFRIMATRHEGGRAFKVADGDRIRALCFTYEDAQVVVRSLELAAPYFGRPDTSRRTSR